MERLEFKAIVNLLEGRAKRLPRLYRFGVITRALFGYFFFYLLLLVSLAAIGGAAWIVYTNPPAWILAAALVAGGIYGVVFVVRALQFRLDPPIGVIATREQYPGLWKFVDDLRARTGNPKVHRILLTTDFGAAIIQTPRRGLITGYRNTLACGVPLMLQLSEAEFAAVVAHELAHLAGKHGAISAWAYRLYRVWGRVLEQTQNRPRHPMARFIRWYAPRFAAHSHVLRRAQEYQADKSSVEIAGIETTGDALVASYLRSAAVNEFWEKVWRRAAEEVDPPSDVMRQMVNQPWEVDPVEVRKELARNLAARTEPHSSHPSLTERLEAAGYLKLRGTSLDAVRTSPTDVAAVLPLPPIASTSAATTLFGDQLDIALDAVSDSWATTASEAWDSRHNLLLRDRGRLALLDRKAEKGEITSPEALDRAMIVESIEGDARLAELLDLAHKLGETSAPAIYAKGRHLLKKYDATGVPLVEQAMELDPEAVIPGGELLHAYHSQQNDHDAAEKVLEKVDHVSKRIGMASEERSRLPLDEEFDLHEQPRKDVRRLICVLRDLYPVQRAYLVRRKLQHFPGKPSYALVIFATTPWR